MLAYGKADCNGRAAAQLYAERFPNRHTQHYSSFEAIERRLREAGKFHVCTVYSRVTCACYMYTGKYCTTVVSIFYNVFPLLGVKTWCGSSTFDTNTSVWGGYVVTGLREPIHQHSTSGTDSAHISKCRMASCSWPAAPSIPSAKSPRITGGGLPTTSTVYGVVFTTMHTAATILELGAIHRRMHVYPQWNFKPA